MKRLAKYAVALLLGIMTWSCGEEKLDSNSVFVDSPRERTPFDNWLQKEFTIPYNIEVKYWLDDKETNQTNQLSPAKIEHAKIMAVLMKHLWLDTYAEASPEGVVFVKKYATRIIQFIGSGGYQSNGTKVLGTAEGGKKITMYDLDALHSPETIEPVRLLQEKGYFQVIHHEFGHILHQTKNYPDTYQQISMEDYTGSNWNAPENTLAVSLDLGFITTYARQNPDEDLVEMFSMYITMTEAQWNARVGSTSAQGQDRIGQKLVLLKDYLGTAWGLDLDGLRAIILRRANEVKNLEMVNLQ